MTYILASVVVIILAITRNRGFRSEGKHILLGMLLVALGIVLQLYFWEDSFILLTFFIVYAYCIFAFSKFGDACRPFNKVWETEEECSCI